MKPSIRILRIWAKAQISILKPAFNSLWLLLQQRNTLRTSATRRALHHNLKAVQLRISCGVTNRQWLRRIWRTALVLSLCQLRNLVTTNRRIQLLAAVWLSPLAPEINSSPLSTITASKAAKHRKGKVKQMHSMTVPSIVSTKVAALWCVLSNVTCFLKAQAGYESSRHLSNPILEFKASQGIQVTPPLQIGRDHKPLYSTRGTDQLPI